MFVIDDDEEKIIHNSFYEWRAMHSDYQLDQLWALVISQAMDLCTLTLFETLLPLHRTTRKRTD